MLGILIDGANHFIVRGPEPTDAEARELVRRWSLISIGSGVDATQETGAWRVSTREYREELQWAVAVGPLNPSDAVRMLLEEMVVRGIAVRVVSR